MLAGGLALWASHPYAGVTVDSAEYLAVAEGLSGGDGFTMPYVGYDEPYRVMQPGERTPMTQFPPLYPALLSLVDLVLPGDLLVAARWLGATLYAAVLVVGAWVVGRFAEGVWTPLIAAGLLLAPDLLTLHAMAWSEPPMILALLGCLYFAASYLRSGSAPYLGLAFGLASVASLARFAGIAYIAAIALLVIFEPGRPMVRRLMLAVGGGLLAMLPVVAWFLRNVSVAGEASEKDIAWHPPGVKHLLQAVESVGAWVIPGRVLPLAVGAIVIIAAAAAAIRRRGPAPSEMTRTCVIFFGIYLAFVVTTRTLLDQNIVMDLRILSPLHVIAIVGTCCALRARSRADLRAPIAAGFALLALLTLGRAFFVAPRFSEISIAAYSGTDWRNSETLRAAAELPDGLPIVSNAPDPLWLWQDRLPFLVPPRSNRYSGAPNEEYLGQIEELRERLGCDGVLVWFDRPTRKPPRIIDPDLAAGLELERSQDLVDGEIYRTRRCGEV